MSWAAASPSWWSSCRSRRPARFSAAASRGEWDVAFLAVDPERAKEISFSNPYVVIEGAYLVRSASPRQTVPSVDGEGTRVAVAQGSAYDLFLSRALQHATLERATSTPDAADLFLTQHLDVFAGVRQPLEQTASANPGLRLIPGTSRCPAWRSEGL